VARTRKAKILLTVVIAVLATAFVAFLVLNLSLGDKKIDRRVESQYTTGDPQFLRTMGSMLGPAIIAGNRAATLVNGDRIFPALLEALRSARQTINFETYIYWQGEIGKEFADALSERSRAGVKVRVMLDWVGSGKIDASYLEQMQQAGVEVQRYNKPAWYSFGRMNNRTHRKLLIVDGKVGFTGGVGIADQWSGNAQDENHWRDTHFRIEGPAVAQMQTAFHENWSEVTGKVLHGADFYPELKPAGNKFAQVFTSSPGSGSENMHMMYLLSIAAAAQTIRLSASYFVPDEVAMAAFLDALKRGVKVQIILPGPKIDAALVRRASRASWGPLLEHGAEIHEYQPTMFHCKVMIVDELWTSVGSTNFDNRSFSINDEANLNIYDREFAREQVAEFEKDLRASRRITLEEWRNRPWTTKLWEHTIGLFSSQL
jgi:cardiolipin synthase